MSSFTDSVNLNVFPLAPLSWWVPIRPGGGAITVQQYVVRAAVRILSLLGF